MIVKNSNLLYCCLKNSLLNINKVVNKKRINVKVLEIAILKKKIMSYLGVCWLILYLILHQIDQN